jgi:hypothetical protein
MVWAWGSSGWTAEESGFDSWLEQEILFLHGVHTVSHVHPASYGIRVERRRGSHIF